MLRVSPLGDHFRESGIMVKKWFSGVQKDILKKWSKNGLGHSQRSPKDILKKYSKNGRRDNGARGQAQAQGAVSRARPWPSAPWAWVWARAPLSRRPFFEYFLSMSFGDLWDMPQTIFLVLFEYVFWDTRKPLF